jgi:secondary thiamine-phosphate synthase enzyme
MEAFAPTTCRHAKLRFKTEQPTEFLDVTDDLKKLVAQSGIRLGVVNVQSLHTTMAVVVNENEPLLLTDFMKVLEQAAPVSAGYRHDDASIRTANLTPGEPANGHAHCRALFLPSSACINVVEGSLELGVWQRVFLVELDGPRHRELSVTVLGEGWR